MRDILGRSSRALERAAMRFLTVPAAAAILLLLTPCATQAASPAPPVDTALKAKIDAGVVALMNATHTQAVSIAIVEDGKIVYIRGYGMRDVAKSLPAEAGTRYEVGSITKQFTAAAILQLKERGKVDLDAPLDRYLPKAPHAADVTIRQLLTHTSGLADFVDAPDFDNAAGTPIAFDQLIARDADKPLGFKPGTRFGYSSTNFLLLGRVVEVVSGQTWENYIKQHIFGPAGMRESATIAEEATLADMARGYDYANGTTTPAKLLDESWAAGAGGIVTTAGDLAKWDEALSSGRVISAADYQALTTPQHFADGSASEYGFGMYVDTFEGQPRIWHNGNTIGYDASNQSFPQQGVRVIALTNAANGGSDQIVARIFNDLFPAIALEAIGPRPGEDPAITARIKAFFNSARSGQIDRTQMTDAYSARFTDEAVKRVGGQLASLGEPTSWAYRGKVDDPTGSRYMYLIQYPTIMLRLNARIEAATNKFSMMRIEPNK